VTLGKRADIDQGCRAGQVRAGDFPKIAANPEPAMPWKYVPRVRLSYMLIYLVFVQGGTNRIQESIKKATTEVTRK